jgi:chloramphenicol 3-O phosphotransferase
MSPPTRAPIAIVVNGPSSAGKSTLCEHLHRALVRRRASHPDAAAFFRVAFDDFLHHVHPHMLPRSFLLLTGGDIQDCASRAPHDGAACFEYVDETLLSSDEREASTTRLARLVLSSVGERFLVGQTLGWGAHLALGTNLLVDAFLQDEAWAVDLRGALTKANARVLLVGLDGDVETLERRERARGDRFPGMARRSARVVHAHDWPREYHVRASIGSGSENDEGKATVDVVVQRVLQELARLEES